MSWPGERTLLTIPTVGTHPDKVAVISEAGEVITYAQLGERASRVASVLQGRGLEPGDVVAILWDNDPGFLEVAWGCRMAGVYFVTLNPKLGPDEIAYILSDSGATGLLASSAASVFAELEPLPVRLLRGPAHDGWEDLDGAMAAATPFEAVTELEGTLLQYSSGTTGRPKGIKRALRPYPKVLEEDPSTLMLRRVGIGFDATYLCPAPLYHTAPFAWTMCALRNGATVVLMRRFEPQSALGLIERHGVTHGQFVPTMFTRMLKLPEAERLGFDVSSLQGAVHAAAPCPIEVKRSMIAWWGPIIDEYWSSSEGAGFTFITAAEWLERPGSVGRPTTSVLHICDEAGQELPVGEVGIIWAEGASEFSYLNDPAKNAETTSRDGWRSVGDVGRLDEDGYLYLTDRATFMIISGGVNIYPQEAENLLIEHPKVYDAAVLGLPDDDLGERAVAVVQALDPAAAGPELAAELTAWCEARLARYKCPREIRFATELPRSETGKLFKKQLRAELIALGFGA